MQGFGTGEWSGVKNLTWRCDRGLKGDFRQDALSDWVPGLSGRTGCRWQ